MDAARDEGGSSVSVDAALLNEARQRNIPVEMVARRAIERALRDRMTPEERRAEADAWREENAEALARLREWNETHPSPLADIQALRPDGTLRGDEPPLRG